MQNGDGLARVKTKQSIMNVPIHKMTIHYNANDRTELVVIVIIDNEVNYKVNYD